MRALIVWRGFAERLSRIMSAEVVFDWLEYHGRATPDAMAVSDLPTGRVFGYREFNERATRLATALRKVFGIGKTDRVAMLAHNSSDQLETLFACWKLGAVFMPLNFRLSADELGAIVANGEPRVLLYDEEFASLTTAIKGPRVLRSTNLAASEYEALLRDHMPAVVMTSITYDDMNMLMYTSGTTGQPKGVIYNHRMSMNNAVHAALHAAVNRESRMLAYSPLFHPVELCGAVSLFHWGSSVVVMKGFDPQRSLELLTDARANITHAIGAPAHYIAMSRLPGFASAKFPCVKMLGVGDAPVSRELLEAWDKKGAPLSQWYGLAEAFSVALIPPHLARGNYGAAGYPMMHVEIRIGDEFGRELARGEVGEIQVRGPGVTPGYWRDEEASRQGFVQGWLRTGDAGRLEKDGTVRIVNRIKDTYVTSGDIVYPIEVERAIAELEGVANVAAIGVKDAKWGTVGLALVIAKPGAKLDTTTILAHCREQLGKYKTPKYVRLVEKLPLTLQGEVLKRELRAQYADFTG
jgi:fatty-acyl-CoA synthase